MKDLTIVIPIHEYNEEISALLGRAIGGLSEAVSFYKDTTNFSEKVKVAIVGPKDICEKILLPDTYDVIKIENEKSDFSTQINVAVKNITTKYFTILEFDDVFFKKWFVNVEKYMSIHENVSVFLPLTEIFETRNDENITLTYANEAVWATSFSDELGFLDLESLENFGDFNMTGAVFNRNDFMEVGGLKASMKLTFWYEFLMRMAYNKKRMYTIPKVGYFHSVGREGSLIAEYNKTLSPDEAQWWIDLAKKEYYFKDDRNKTYDGE